MNVALFDSKPYDLKFFQETNKDFGFSIDYYEAHLNAKTEKLVDGHEAVCVFVNDILDEQIIQSLAQKGVRLIALRCAGFNNVDIKAAHKLGIQVARVPRYSPYGVAEHAVALILALSRKVYRSYNRVRDGNFSLDGLIGFELHDKTVGLVGTGKIGTVLAGILKGFGCKLLAYDPYPNEECKNLGVTYLSLEDLYKQSDIVSLHTPLNPQTHHIVDAQAIEQMKQGVMIINTSRGGLIDTKAIIEGLKSEKIAYVGLDVYEEESDIFFKNFSEHVIKDDLLSRLLTFPNVLITGHQAFLTNTALTNIAQTTLQNIADLKEQKIPQEHLVTVEQMQVGS